MGMGKGFRQTTGCFTTIALATTSVLLSSCAKNSEPSFSCATPDSPGQTGNTGSALVFNVDPVASSRNPSLGVASSELDDFRTEVTLSRLNGRGVLEGTHVTVSNDLACRAGFTAYDKSNRFSYSQADPRFQEVMGYYYADQYSQFLAELGSTLAATPLSLHVHCGRDEGFYDEAYFDPQSGIVCIGDPAFPRTASYADDAAVLIHEVQHAHTLSAYSPVHDLGWLLYDEAGALNEAVSDFMSLAYLSPLVPDGIDPLIFSRWALGTFFGTDESRGAHRCPRYDASFAQGCSRYRSGPEGFSADQNSVSFTYPDGLNWPFTSKVSGPGYVQSAFTSPAAMEEIHNNASMITGTLWDIFATLTKSRGGTLQARKPTMALVLESLRRLPKPDLSNRSPVTFPGFAQTLLDIALTQGSGISAEERGTIRSILKDRGLVDSTVLGPGWAKVGAGSSAARGVRILDDPMALGRWMTRTSISQGIDARPDGRLGPGETAAIWFDIENTAEDTAGGLLLTVKVDAPEITVAGEGLNYGSISPKEAQVRYAKVNGRRIVQALSSRNSAMNVPTGTTYFLTQPRFDRVPMTALFIRCAKDASSGKTVNFQVRIEAANGDGTPETLEFPVTIR